MTRDFRAPAALATDGRSASGGRWVTLSMIMIGLGLLALLIYPTVSPSGWWVHGAWCLAAFVTIGWTLARVLREGPTAILTDHRVMFAGAFLLYFVIGAALPSFASEALAAHALRYYAVTPAQALWIDALNSIGLGLAIFAATLSTSRSVRAMSRQVAGRASGIPPEALVAAFALIGAVATWVTLGVDLGSRVGVVAGTWRTAANLILVAIVLGASDGGKRRLLVHTFAVLLTICEATLGLLMLNKGKVLLAIGALTLGMALRGQSKKVLVIGALLLALTFGAIGGVVQYGRNTVAAQGPTGLAGRAAILARGFELIYSPSSADDYSAWSRLCYLSPQNAARDLYDAGRGEDVLRLIPWVFVPRVIAPEKPVITAVGRELQTAITGNTLSATSSGIFVEGYYGAGWMGWFSFSIVCGLILAQTSAVAQVAFRERTMVLVPFVLLGLKTAFRIDGHFASDYLGSFVIVLYALALLAVGLPALGRRGE